MFYQPIDGVKKTSSLLGKPVDLAGLIPNMKVYLPSRFVSAVAPMVQNAKGVAQNPRDGAASGRWRGTNQQVRWG